MTVHSKLKETIANIEAAKANCDTFAEDTDDQMAKQMFRHCAQTLDSTAKQLQDRLKYVESQEPQFTQPPRPR